MGHRIGIIAGSGIFPFLALEEAQKRGYTCVVAGIKEEAEAGLRDKADEFDWIERGDISKVISFFKKHGVREALLAGKVDHRRIFQKEKLDRPLSQLLNQIKEKSPTAIIKAIIDFMNKEGIQVVNPTSFLASHFCQEGIMTETKPSQEVKEDIHFGLRIARKIADLDIGQTVMVKDKAVVAVEGIEGTDEAIKRGGKLAGEGIVVAKVSRSCQDMRIDIPAVGLSTVKMLAEVGGAALCIEAQKVLFFQKKEAISLANAYKIMIMAKEFIDIQ